MGFLRWLLGNKVLSKLGNYKLENDKNDTWIWKILKNNIFKDTKIKTISIYAHVSNKT